MTTTIESIISGILQAEAWPVISDRAADRGGLTKGGIRFDYWHARTGGTRDQFVALTEADARAYYRRYYVDEPHLDGLPEPLRTMVVDWYVTSGGEAVKALQLALHARGLYAGAIDGVIGPKTTTALEADADPGATYRAVALARIDFYQTLALVHDPDVRLFLLTHPKTDLHNLRGWTRRAADFLR